jgi:hypothetical protein
MRIIAFTILAAILSACFQPDECTTDAECGCTVDCLE